MRRTKVAAVMLLALLMMGCTRETERKTDAKKVYTREEFKKEFLGATLDEVRAKLGAPDLVSISEDRWEYKGRTRDSKTGKIDDYVSVSHKDGRVVSAGD